MRILAVQDTDWFERGPHQQHHLLERLSLRGHSIRVLDYPLLWKQGKVRGNPAHRQCFGDGARLVPHARVEVIRPPIWRVRLLDFASHLKGMAREVQRQCRVYKPDLLLGYGILSDWGAVRAAKRHGVPYVSHLLDALHQLVEPSFFRGLARRIETYNLRRARRVIVVNRALRDYAVSLGATGKDTYVVPTGIDFERFKPIAGRERMREKLAIQPHERVLFFMGWLYRFSGVLELARSLLDLSSPTNNFRFLIVGEGDLLAELTSLCNTHRNGQRLIITGQQPYRSIPDYLSAADICVLPAANNETMRHIVPIKIYEYLAAGKPVLATELPGLIAEFGTSSGVRFVKDLSSLFGEAERLFLTVGQEELARSALDTVQGRDWTTIADQFEAVLEEACR